MSLIKVREIGFGLSGTELDLVIDIPKDSYLISFRVYTQKDVEESKCASTMGIDYIESQGIPEQNAFHILFGEKIDTYTDPVTQEEYDVYNLKNGSLGVNKVSQKDITFIHMEIPDYSVEVCSDAKLTVPLFNLTPMRLAALDVVKSIKTDCEVPKEFLNKLLQIKAIETALCCGAYCDAAKFWSMFYSEGIAKPFKQCGCHGGAV